MRERVADIPILAEHFIHAFCERNHFEAPVLMEDAKSLLMDQYWSGNVRELRNTIESVLTLERGVSQLGAAHFRAHLQAVSNPHLLPMQINRPPEQLERELLFHMLLDMKREISEVKNLLLSAIEQGQNNTINSSAGTKLVDLEREQILRTLEEHNGSRRKTARVLGIGERTLYRKLKEYNLA